MPHRRRRCTTTGLVLLLHTLLVGGCDRITAPAEVVVGVIEASPPFEALRLPDTVRVGESFPVTITTLGLSSCWSPGDVRVEESPERIKVVPLDRIRGEVCASTEMLLARTVVLRFPTVGTKTIRMTGRSWSGREPLGSVVREWRVVAVE